MTTNRPTSAEFVARRAALLAEAAELLKQRSTLIADRASAEAAVAAALGRGDTKKRSAAEATLSSATVALASMEPRLRGLRRAIQRVDEELPEAIAAEGGGEVVALRPRVAEAESVVNAARIALLRAQQELSNRARALHAAGLKSQARPTRLHVERDVHYPPSMQGGAETTLVKRQSFPASEAWDEVQAGRWRFSDEVLQQLAELGADHE